MWLIVCKKVRVIYLDFNALLLLEIFVQLTPRHLAVPLVSKELNGWHYDFRLASGFGNTATYCIQQEQTNKSVNVTCDQRVQVHRSRSRLRPRLSRHDRLAGEMTRSGLRPGCLNGPADDTLPFLLLPLSPPQTAIPTFSLSPGKHPKRVAVSFILAFPAVGTAYSRRCTVIFRSHYVMLRE